MCEPLQNCDNEGVHLQPLQLTLELVVGIERENLLVNLLQQAEEGGGCVRC